MRTVKTGWDQFRLPANLDKKPQPASGQGVTGVDRVAIDNLTLERDVAEAIKEVWEEE